MSAASHPRRTTGAGWPQRNRPNGVGTTGDCWASLGAILCKLVMVHRDLGLSGSHGTPHSRPGGPMRVRRQLKILITLGSFATVASLAACMSYGRHNDSQVSAGWDSGPLDRAYTH